MAKRMAPTSIGVKREIRALTSEHELELRAEQCKEDGQTHLTGYTARYGILSDNLGTAQRPWKERIMPGAFTKALQSADDIKHLQNHNPDIVLGSTKAGTTKLTEDARGLHFDTVLDVEDNMFARAVASSVRRRDVTGQSFGMIVSKGGDKWITENGIDVREIHNIDVFWDLSTVTNPAYPATSVNAEMRMAQLFPDGQPASIDQHFDHFDADAEQKETMVDAQDHILSRMPALAPLATTSALPASAPLAAADEAKKTKHVDGEDLTSTDFLIAPDPSDIKTWKLAWRFSSLEKTKFHLRNALSRFNQLKGVTDSDKASAWPKLVRLCKKYGVKVTEDGSKKSETCLRYRAFLADGGQCGCDCQNCQDADCDSCTLEDCEDSDCQEAGCPMQKAANHFEQFSIEDLSSHLQLRDPETRARLASLPAVEIRSKVQTDGTLELYLYGTVGSDWWGGGMTADGMRYTIAQADPHTNIRLCINSMGGDAFEGAAMYNLLRQQGKPIHTRVDGMAASAASIAAMAGDKIEMGSNTMMMIHNAQTGVRGYAKELRKTADTLEKVSTALANTYTDRTGMSMADIQALMESETWMTAFDAVRAGFATEITEDYDLDNVDKDLRSSPLTATYQNLPKELVERRNKTKEVPVSLPAVPDPAATTPVADAAALPDAGLAHRKRLLALAAADL